MYSHICSDLLVPILICYISRQITFNICAVFHILAFSYHVLLYYINQPLFNVVYYISNYAVCNNSNKFVYDMVIT